MITTVTIITITITAILASKVLSLLFLVLFSLDFLVNLQSLHARSSVKSACKNLAMSKRYINKRSRPGVSDTMHAEVQADFHGCLWALKK